MVKTLFKKSEWRFLHSEWRKVSGKQFTENVQKQIENASEKIERRNLHSEWRNLHSLFLRSVLHQFLQKKVVEKRFFFLMEMIFQYFFFGLADRK